MTPAARAITHVERQGELDAEQYIQGSLPLRACPLGSFSTGRWSARLLRRFLLRLRVSPRLVARVRPAIPRSKRDAFDRIVRIHAYWTGARRRLRPAAIDALAHGPVILMYHAIGDAQESASCYVVPRRRFRLQMAFMKWSGMHVLSCAQLVSLLRRNRIPPRRSVVITFDDGYADNWWEALPVLRRYGFGATVFVVSDGIGHHAWWPSDPALADRPMLTNQQISGLHSSGVEIGAHSRTHPSLPALSIGAVDEELRASRATLERTVGGPVRTCAYPFGECSPAVIDAAERAGFDGACCSRSGVVDPSAPLFALPRLEVRGTDTLLSFALMLWRGHRSRHSRTRRTLQEATT